MTLYINKYVALIKAFRKYIHNNNKIVCIGCKVYKHILNTKRKEIKKNVQQRSRGGVDIKIYNRFMYEVLFVTPPPLHLCMKHGTIEMVEQETHDRFTGDQIKKITIT